MTNYHTLKKSAFNILALYHKKYVIYIMNKCVIYNRSSDSFILWLEKQYYCDSELF